MAAAVLLACGLVGQLLGVRAQESRPDFAELIKSTVQIAVCMSLAAPDSPISLDVFIEAQLDFEAAMKRAAQTGQPLPHDAACGLGSGTVLDPGGRILTNAHVANDWGAAPDGQNPMDAPVWALVLRTTDARALPQPMFFAHAVTWSPLSELDLAILEPARALDGTPLRPGDVSLPPLPIAPLGSVDIGDPLVNIGYPGIGGGQITLLEGIVSGFEADPSVPQMARAAWIKTDALIGGGISGGTSVNLAGQLIGVPTQLGLADARYDESGKLVNIAQINKVRPIPEAFAVMAQTARGAPIGPDGQPLGDGAATPDPQPLPPAQGERPPAMAGAAFISGQVVSADTGKGIGQAQVLVLEPGITVAGYRAGGAEGVLAFAATAADGTFTLPKPVTVGQAYGVLVMAAGFRNAEQDGVVLAPEGSGTAVTLAPFSLARRR